jgi:predicted RNA-binding protein
MEESRQNTVDGRQSLEKSRETLKSLEKSKDKQNVTDSHIQKSVLPFYFSTFSI